MMRFIRNLFICLMFSVTLNSFGNSKSAEKFLNKYTSRTWTVSEGLPANTVTDIIQNSDGYIYAGTYEGLVRFDGIQFTTLNSNSNKLYSFISARSLFTDSKGNLWVGANDEGITCIKRDGTTVSFNTKNGLPNNSIRAFAEDGQGTIWIGTSSGIACIKDEQIIYPEGIDFLPKGNSYLIKQLFTDLKGQIWIVTGDTGQCFCYRNDTFYVHGGFRSTNIKSITSVGQDKNGNLWFGLAPNYLVKLENQTEKLFELDFGTHKPTVISTIFEDSDNNIWVGTDYGVAVIHDEEIIYITEKDGLSDNKLSKIFEDIEGNIWMATDKGGLQKYTFAKFNEIILKNTVNAIAEDANRNCIWFATDEGLYCYQNEGLVKNKITDYCKNERIRQVSVTKDGTLLISSYNTLGQIVVTPDNKISSWKKQNGLAGSKVRVALSAQNEDLYVGTTTGLSIIDKNNQISEIKKDTNIRNDYIMCLYEDQNGNVWCGTDGGGIFILKDHNFEKSITTDDGLVGNVIFKIDQIVEGQVWVATGNGLSIIKGDQIYNFNSSNGLGSDSVFQAINDGRGKIWFTSNRGIFSVREDEFEKVISGNKEKLESKFYARSDGIKSNGVTSTSLSCLLSNGDLMFTMIDGVARYDSHRALSKRIEPIICVEEIYIGNNKYKYDYKPIYIDHDQNRISIKFTGLSYSSPDQILFQTKLEGFDTDYSDWTIDRTVSYTNLSPKTYRLSIRAMNSDGIIGTIAEEIIIIQRPALWQRIWFWFLVMFYVAGMIYFIVKRRIKNFKKEQEKIQKLYVEVTTALAGTIDAKDTYTNGHSNRVAVYSKMLAASLGKSEDYQDNIYNIAILHDIGKIGIPDSIINKTDKLTDEEYAIIKKHPEIGSDILKSITSMPEVGVGARWHHERYDGKGYPDRLAGENIPEIARIICVADSYDAMSSNRSYRKYLPQNVIREELVKCSGTQFDPVIADKMIELIDADKNYTMHE